MTKPAWHNARSSLPASWQAAIADAFDTPAMRDLAAFVAAERAAGKRVFPEDALTFAALSRTPLDQVKAVILGQDPYHRPGQAMGLSFSVPPGVAVPPSLRNIHKELTADVGVPAPGHGCLTAWAEQGVLLLNTALSVEARDTPVAFLLWGSHAQKKAAMVDGNRHLVHRSEHPSPLAAYRGFFGSRPFSKANEFFRSRGAAEIDWSLPA